MCKNQSIWAEANLKYCRENNISLAKRLSGGGTVYHDRGNLNFCYITPKNTSWVSNFGVFNAPIISFLESLGLQATESPRHDILIKGHKISGNAQHLSGDYLISHATLLYEANLDNVSSSLRPAFKSVISKGIDSNRVPVTNISDHLTTHLPLGSFSEGLLKHIENLLPNSEMIELNSIDQDEIQKLASQKFCQDEWIYGRSPKTTIEIQIGNSEYTLELINGICNAIKTSGLNKSEINLLEEWLIGSFMTYSHLMDKISFSLDSQSKHFLTNFLENSGL